MAEETMMATVNGELSHLMT